MPGSAESFIYWFCSPDTRSHPQAINFVSSERWEVHSSGYAASVWVRDVCVHTRVCVLRGSALVPVLVTPQMGSMRMHYGGM